MSPSFHISISDNAVCRISLSIRQAIITRRASWLDLRPPLSMEIPRQDSTPARCDSATHVMRSRDGQPLLIECKQTPHRLKDRHQTRVDADDNPPKLTVDDVMESIFSFCPALRHAKLLPQFIRCQLEMANVKCRQSLIAKLSLRP